MSLMDALLLDEYRDPKDIWVTQRGDGRPGSGTANQPADGGAPLAPPLWLTSPLAFDKHTFLVRTTQPHGYANGAVVTLSATDTSGRSGRGPWFGVAFTITWISEFAFTCQVTSDPEGPPDPMYGATCPSGPGVVPSTTLTALLFWPVAKVLAPNHGLSDYDAIRVQGVTPSEFNGDAIAVGVDSAKTTSFFYRLSQGSVPAGTSGVGGAVSRYQFRFDEVLRAASAGSLIRLGSAPPTNPFLTRGVCSAFVTNSTAAADDWVYYPGVILKDHQRILGSGIDATTVRLAFAVDPNNQTSVFGRLSTPTQINSGEIADLTADCWMQGQLTVPNLKQAAGFAPVTLGGVALYGSNLRLRRVRAIGFGPQCKPESFALYLNGGTNPAIPAANNVIEDCIAEIPADNNFHESTIIYAHSPYGTGEQVEVAANGQGCAARRNYVNCRLSFGSTEPLWISNMTVPRPPSQGGDGKFTVTTARPHNRAIGNAIAIHGVGPANADSTPHILNGWFTVVGVSPPLGLTCLMFDTPAGIPTPNFDGAAIMVDFHGPVAFAGTGGVVEGNSVYDCLNPAYNDTGSTRDIVFRYNYYSDAYTGFNQNLTGHTTLRPLPTTGVSLAGGQVVEVDTSTAHYLTEGDIVELSGINSTGLLPDPAYNGVFFVDKWVSTTKFQYRLASPPTYPLPASQTSAFYTVYAQTKRAVLESNCVDLYQNTPTALPNAQGCISVQGQKVLPGYPAWVIRDNFFRHTDGIPTKLAGLPGLCPAVRMTGLNGGVVQSNLIDLEAPYPLQYLRTVPPPPVNPGNMNNTTMAGRLLRGGDFPSDGNSPDGMYDEIARRIEDSLVFCL